MRLIVEVAAAMTSQGHSTMIERRLPSTQSRAVGPEPGPADEIVNSLTSSGCLLTSRRTDERAPSFTSLEVLESLASHSRDH